MPTAGLAEARRLAHENEELRARLEEAEETLRAIRSGEVDAIVTVGPQGEQVYTLFGAERPYRVLIEAMQEGAATLMVDGTLLYCNAGLARLFGQPLEHLPGTRLGDLLRLEDRATFAATLARGAREPASVDLELPRARGRAIPVQMSLNPVTMDGEDGVCLVVTDLSERRRREEERALLQALPLAVGQAADLEEALQTVLRTVCTSTLWPAGEIWVHADGRLRRSAFHAADPRLSPFLDAGTGLTLLPGEEVVGRAWQARTPLWEACDASKCARAPLGRILGLRDVVGIPVLAQDEVVAVVAFFLDASTEVEERTIRIVNAAVAQLGPIIQRRRTEDRIAASLREKEALLKEVHHRVKNNLQVVSALLALQARRTKDTEVRAMFRESERRIRSMALIHEALYRSPDLGRIDFSEYLHAFCAQLAAGYVLDPDAVRVEARSEPVFFEIEAAVPLAFLVNELVTNALKHAFPDGRTGCIRVELSRPEPGTLELSVADDGVGVAPAAVEARPATMGMQVVRTLVRQLDGTMDVDHARGTAVRIRFPLPAGGSA